MKDCFVFSKIYRAKIAAWAADLSAEQLNFIPQGMRNNIAWHIGHMLVTTPALCYVRTGVEPNRVVPYFDKYKNGTKPESFIEKSETMELANQLVTSLEAIQVDYNNGKFKSITPYSTMTFGVEMQDIETVFDCCSQHDMLHIGWIMALKNLV